MLYKFATEN